MSVLLPNEAVEKPTPARQRFADLPVQMREFQYIKSMAFSFL